MADLYASLTPAQQATFRSKLYSVLEPSGCPNVDVSSVTSADTLTDAGNRGIAIDCVQQRLKVGSSGPGVLDQATYSAIMHLGLSMAEKVVLGAVGILGLTLIFGRRRGRGRRR